MVQCNSGDEMSSIKKRSRIHNFYHTRKNSYMFRLYVRSHHQAGYETLNKKTIKIHYNTISCPHYCIVFLQFHILQTVILLLSFIYIYSNTMWMSCLKIYYNMCDTDHFNLRNCTAFSVTTVTVQQHGRCYTTSHQTRMQK